MATSLSQVVKIREKKTQFRPKFSQSMKTTRKVKSEETRKELSLSQNKITNLKNKKMTSLPRGG